MEVKTQEQVLKLFSACVVIISIESNEQNTRFLKALDLQQHGSEHAQ